MKTSKIVGLTIVALALASVTAGTLILKNQAKIHAKAENRDRHLADAMWVDVSSTIHINSLADVDAKRRQLTQLLWNADQVPAGSPDVSWTPAENGGEFEVALPAGIRSKVAYRTHQDSSCLAIYHEGHANPTDPRPNLVKDMFEAGCDTLVFDMPLMGQNNQPTVQTLDGPVKLSAHGYLTSVDLPAGYHALRLFVDPVRQVLNRVLLQHDYDRVIMTGLSGGGWTTTVYAAADPRIQISVPVAGSLPTFLLTIPPVANPADFEQHHPDLVQRFGYLDLYLMASDRGRVQVQMLNRYDNCCFAGEASAVYRPHLAARAKALGGRWDQFIDNASRHHVVTDQMSRRTLQLLQ